MGDLDAQIEHSAALLDRLKAIVDLHTKDATPDGRTSGACKECGLGWPCPTVHYALGYGDMHACWDARWCTHLGEIVSAAEAGYLDE